MTGLQTLLPIMLNHVAAGRLNLTRLVDLVSSNPARTLTTNPFKTAVQLLL